MTQTEKMRPILFNTDMVRAILNGGKTQTRRVIKPQPPCELKIMSGGRHDGEWHLWCDSPMIDRVNNSPWGARFVPLYDVGDLLWVRETWGRDDEGRIVYLAQSGREACRAMRWLGIKWRPSIHMPREAARIFLRVTSVRVERLQDITIEDSRREGYRPFCSMCVCYQRTGDGGRACEKGIGRVNDCQLEDTFGGFSDIWNATIKAADRSAYGWDANPWVWVIEFEREKPAREGGADHDG